MLLMNQSDDLSLEVPHGGVFGLMGNNGGGRNSRAEAMSRQTNQAC
jgi:ABC-type uncharacterized transport system ATPase subunit